MEYFSAFYRGGPIPLINGGKVLYRTFGPPALDERKNKFLIFFWHGEGNKKDTFFQKDLSKSYQNGAKFTF